MTPAVTCLRRHRAAFTLHRYSHDADRQAYGLEAVEKLGLDPNRVFKTIVVTLDGGELGVALLPVSGQLDLKKAAHCFGVKKTVLADGRVVEKTTGYVLGGVSPLGQKKRLRTVLDESAAGFSTIFVSGGRRGLQIELDPADLARLCNARLASIT